MLAVRADRPLLRLHMRPLLRGGGREAAANMRGFLPYAWGRKRDPLYGFHGLPDLLVWDCGSANVSKPVTNALKALRVETRPRMPGNPPRQGAGRGGAEHRRVPVREPFAA